MTPAASSPTHAAPPHGVRADAFANDAPEPPLVVVLASLPVLQPPSSVPSAPPADTRAPAVRLVGVTHRYPSGVRALDSINLAIPTGRHTVIVGASGSGKTTLIGCLSGRITPTAGAIERSGSVATIYQDLRLVSQRSVLGNVLDGALGRTSLWRSVLGMPEAERREALRMIERVGLRDRAALKVGHLSGGERQRVAIARALMQRPGILLADEPVSSLDRINAESIMDLLRSVCAERGITLVSVLHDESLVTRYADHRICLHAGHVVGCAATAARLSAPRGTSVQPGEGCHAQDSRPDHAGPTACAASNPRGATPPFEPIRPTWMKPGAILGIGLIAVVAYAWSVVSLGLHDTAGRSVVRGLGSFLTALVPTSFAQVAAIPWPTLLGSLVETLQMSLIGTTLGLAVAYPLSAIAARNTAPRLIGGPVRQMLNAIRTVPALIWALLFVAAVGFGQLAGVLALTLYSIGYLTKFFYESFENAPTGPQAALREIGASGPQRFLRAVGPASVPAAIAAGFFMLEYNVRSASVLGIVDAGGIGYHIKFYLDMRQFPAALACLILIFGVVVILDAVSSRVRRRLLPE